MATIRFGTIVTGANGKVGGHYFTTGQGGSMLATNRAVGSRNGTARKLWGYIKRNAQVNSQSWSSLTDAQRTMWEAAASNLSWLNRVGEVVASKGYSYYMQVNGLLAALGQSPVLEPSALVPIGQPDGPAFNVLTTGSIIVTQNYNPSFVEVMVVRLTRPMSAGRKPNAPDYRIVSSFGHGSAGSMDVYNDYVSIFGAPLQNGYVNGLLSVVNTITGQESVKQFFKGKVI